MRQFTTDHPTVRLWIGGFFQFGRSGQGEQHYHRDNYGVAAGEMLVVREGKLSPTGNLLADLTRFARRVASGNCSWARSDFHRRAASALLGTAR